MRSSKQAQITPILYSLHWLPLDLGFWHLHTEHFSYPSCSLSSFTSSESVSCSVYVTKDQVEESRSLCGTTFIIIIVITLLFFVKYTFYGLL